MDLPTIVVPTDIFLVLSCVSLHNNIFNSNLIMELAFTCDLERLLDAKSAVALTLKSRDVTAAGRARLLELVMEFYDEAAIDDEFWGILDEATPGDDDEDF